MHFKNETCLQIQVTEHDTLFQAITSNNDHKYRLKYPIEDSFYDNLKCPHEGLRDLRLWLLPLLFQHFLIYNSQIKGTKKKASWNVFSLYKHYSWLIKIKLSHSDCPVVVKGIYCFLFHLIVIFSVWNAILFLQETI